jgi:hypothetical protein
MALAGHRIPGTLVLSRKIEADGRDAVMQPYLIGGNQYKVDGENRERQKDALSFLKDWTTFFLTLQTALLTLVGGVLIGIKEL